MICIPLELTLTMTFPLTIRPISGTLAYQWYLGLSVVLVTSQLLSPNFSSSKYTISHMKHDLSNSHPPFYASQANSPNYFYLKQPFEINYLHFISIIGIIGNQWRTQTQLWEQWSTTSLSLDPNNIIITTTPTTSYSDNLNLVASALLSAWAPTSKGVYRLNNPKYPLVGDQLTSYQFYNLPTTKINITLHIQEDTSWKSWYRKPGADRYI